MSLQPETNLRSQYSRFARWVLIDGNRLLITGVVIVLFFILTVSLISVGFLSVGPRSPIQSVLGSGVVAGLFSLISVTLAINQLISSRVFGSLDSLQKKLEGGNDIRDTVSTIADHPSPPISAAGFISFIGETLQEQTHVLRVEHDHQDNEMNEEIDSYADDISEYADQVQQVSSDMPAEKVISTFAGPDFAHHLNQTDELRSKQHEQLTSDEGELLDAIADLLGAVAVFRQYFKTIALHQELAQLSRQFIFVGFPAIVVAVLVPLLYKTNPAEVLTSYPLAPILSASLAIVLTPLVLVLVYMLRIATIFRYTVSVAPFTPPVEWPWTDQPD